MKKIIALTALISIFIYFLFPFTRVQKAKASDPEGTPQWAKSTVAASDYSEFYGVATDTLGNSYAVGTIDGNIQFDFGNSVTVAGAYNSSDNAVIVKYNSSGLAQWAKSTVVGPDGSIYHGVSIDSSGNIYAVGEINGNSQYDFGNSVTVTGNYSGVNFVIVKYNSSGLAQWAKSTVVGPAGSSFYGVSTDSSGNSYVTGYIIGTSQYDFGNSVTVTGGNASYNTVIVKYDSSGVAQWAKSTVVGPSLSSFYSVSTDTSGNSYAAGFVNGTSQYDFGNSVTVTGANAGYNTAIVKYDSSGLAQWAKSTVVGPNASQFYGVSIDSSGNSYAAGNITGTSQFDFGNSVTVTGANSTGYNTVIVKYDSSGLAQWAKSTVVGPDSSEFYGVSSDSSGNSYATGYVTGVSQYDFGNSVTVTGNYSGTNTLIIKYDSSGVAQWAKSTVVAPTLSIFQSISIDSSGNSYAVGHIRYTSQYDFGNSITVAGAWDYSNIVIVKYSGEPSTATETTTSSSSGSSFIQIPESSGQVTSPLIVGPIEDSNTGGQTVLAIIQPNTFNFDAFFSVIKSSPIVLTKATTSPSVKGNTVIAGGGEGLLGIKSTSGVSWQIGKIQEIWYKAYPPTGGTAARIIPELQSKPSIIALAYKDSDLVPPGQPKTKFNPKNLKLAYSLDGRTWKKLPNSVVDTINHTVAVVEKVGGYYMIVSK